MVLSFRIQVLSLLAASLCLALLAAVLPSPVCADSVDAPPRTAFDAKRFSFFERNFITENQFSGANFQGQVEDVSETQNANTDDAAEEERVRAENEEAAEQKRYQPVFVSNDPKSHLSAPDERAQVRINPEMPGPFIGMATAYQAGDVVTAAKYADQLVQYQLDVIFQARELADLMGKALVRQGLIDEDDYVGASQYYAWKTATAREEAGDPIRPTHEEALRRIKADPSSEAEIYYFFTLNCSWCRYMAADVERLWRAVKKDQKVKMVALTLGPTPIDWVKEYRQYTGMTVPMAEGAEVARSFNVAFVPAVVVVSPGLKHAYVKTGQQDFKRLYEFVRTVQGLPPNYTPEIQKIADSVIGEMEMAKLNEKGGAKGQGFTAINYGFGGRVRTEPFAKKEESMERF